MALQNALTLIRQLRDEKKSPKDMDEMSLLGKERGLECTAMDLELAFQMDYDMRWAKYSLRLDEECTAQRQ
jgi:hypothetical protein